MKVPHSVIGRTERPSQPQGYLQDSSSPAAFGAQIGKELESFGLSLRAEAEKEDADAKRRAMFDVNMRHSDEALHATQDFAERTANAPLGAEGFTKKVLADYETRHAKIVDEMKQSGAPEEAVQAMQLKLADLRGGLVSQSLTFQRGSYQAKVGADTQRIALNLSQLASMNPAEMEAAQEELFDAVDSIPDLDAVQKQKLKDEYGGTIALAAGYGLAQQAPRDVISALTGTEVEQGGGYYNAIRKHESGGRGNAKNPRSSARGFYQWTDDTWLGLVKRYPNSGLTVGGRGNREQEEIAIRLFTSENAEFLGRSGLAATDANLYAAHFLGAGGAALVLKQPEGRALSSVLSPAVMNANPHLAGKTVGWFKGWTQNVVGKGGVDLAAPPIDGQTGNPVLDALTPAQRAQVLSTARTEYTRQQAEVRAGLSVRVSNAEAAFFSTGDYDGQMPTEEEFYQAYDPVEAEQRWAAFSTARSAGAFIKDMKTLTVGEIAAKVEELRPPDTASPTYAAELEGYKAAQMAQANILKQREADPAGYVIQHFPKVANAWEAAEDSAGRQAAMASMQEAYRALGMRPSQMLPFSTTAIEAKKEEFASYTPEQKIGAIEMMRTEMGSMFQNGLAQLAENGMPVEAFLAGLVATSPEHRGVAANVLRGMQIIAEDPSRKPSAEQVNESFRTALGTAQNVISPTAANAMNTAATALYVFNGGDPKTIIPDDYEAALRQVLGGTADDTNTGIVSMSQAFFSNVDAKTILPPGVNKQQMIDWIDRLAPEDLDRLGNGTPMYSTGEVVAPEHISDEGVFVRVGPEEFIVYMESDGKPLMTESGDYFRMRVTKEVVGAIPGNS